MHGNDRIEAAMAAAHVELDAWAAEKGMGPVYNDDDFDHGWDLRGGLSAQDVHQAYARDDAAREAGVDTSSDTAEFLDGQAWLRGGAAELTEADLLADLPVIGDPRDFLSAEDLLPRGAPIVVGVDLGKEPIVAVSTPWDENIKQALAGGYSYRAISRPVPNYRKLAEDLTPEQLQKLVNRPACNRSKLALLHGERIRELVDFWMDDNASIADELNKPLARLDWLSAREVLAVRVELRI